MLLAEGNLLGIKYEGHLFVNQEVIQITITAAFSLAWLDPDADLLADSIVFVPKNLEQVHLVWAEEHLALILLQDILIVPATVGVVVDDKIVAWSQLNLLICQRDVFWLRVVHHSCGGEEAQIAECLIQGFLLDPAVLGDGDGEVKAIVLV